MQLELLLLLVFVACPVITLYVDAGCEVRSEWRIDYKWTDIDFSVYVPPGGLSSKIITLEIEFEGQMHPAVFDQISLSNENIQLNRIRNGELSSAWNETTISIADGWADFVLTVDSHYGLKHHNNTILPQNVSVDYTPKSLLIKRSNITLHCPSKLRTWEIGESFVPIPLDGSEEHRFSFFSTREFSPSISLEEREFILGWDGETLTTIPSKSQPLPPFVQHRLMLTCQQDQEIICTIKVGEEMAEAEITRFGEIPTSISVKGFSSDNFFLFVHQDNFSSDPNAVELCICEPVGNNPTNCEDSSEYFTITTTINSCISSFLLGISCYFYWRSNKLKGQLQSIQARSISSSVTPSFTIGSSAGPHMLGGRDVKNRRSKKKKE